MENLIEQLKKQYEANLELINKINEEKTDLLQLTESQVSALEEVIARAVSTFDFDDAMEKDFGLDWDSRVTCDLQLIGEDDLVSHIIDFITKQ